MNISEFSSLARFSSDGALNNNHLHIVPTNLNESWAGRRLIEALNQLPPSKFGSSTDIRFQQKQLQEREQRKLEMMASKAKVPEINDNEPPTSFTVKSSTTKNLNSTIGNGKVRQMFNERRRGAGIDRSNPLKPITSRSSSSSSTVTTTSTSSKNAENTITRRHEITALRPINSRKVEKIAISKIGAQGSDNDSVDNCKDKDITTLTRNLETYRIDNDLNNETFPAHLDGFVVPDEIGVGDGDKNNNPVTEKKSKSNTAIKLNPVLTKKSPSAVTGRVPAKPSRTSLNSTTTSQTNLNVNTTQKPTPSKPKIAVKNSPNMAKPLANSNIASKWLPRDHTPPTHPEGTVACRVCSRFFTEDRISKHEEVCEKMSMKQRKIFDASKHRVKGTEAEKFLKKPARPSKSTAKTAAITTSTSATPKKSNWRKKHEEFIAAIRAAKEVQAYLAKGGKLSDLPPPPPSENPDYITCPHCSRRFNEAAANRHIPKCANMLHNKPKPGAKRR